MGTRSITGWIPLDDCEHGVLYRIASRNLRIGIYNEPSKSFVGIRFKFGNRFLDDEDHWDTGAPHGTAKPLEKLGKSPFDPVGANGDYGDRYDAIFAWLDEKLQAEKAG